MTAPRTPPGAPGRGAPAAGPSGGTGPDVPDAGTRSPGTAGTALVAAAYLVLAVVLWWGVWSTHPTATTTCGCGDAARFLWFFEWPSFALTHGHSLLYSTWLFHPTGINLLNDTSVVALGVVLTPVTLVFGPVASMNVALTLAPFASALAMFVLVRRWVRWQPAAFAAGLAYGFSPFMVTELALNQLNIAFLAVPPLVVLCLDELLVRQTRSPYRTGAFLALLLALQFFVSTEVLVITVLAGVVGVVLLAACTALRHPDALAAHAGPALRGAAVAAGGAVVLLAYPLWFLLHGPAHLVGPIWSNGGSLARYGNTLASFWTTGGLDQLRTLSLRFGGYQGPVLPGPGYLGAGVLVVAVVGTVLGRRDRRLLLFAGVGLVAALLSLGPGHGVWVPWQAIAGIPWIGDVVEVRFTLVVTLCVAVIVAIVLDRFHARATARRPPDAAHRWAPVVLTAAMFVPTVAAVWSNVPLTTRPVVLPRWYAEVGARLPPGEVLLAYPVPFSGIQSSQAWQAVNSMRWQQAGGGGPEGQPGRAGRARPGFDVLSAASLPVGPAPGPTPANLAAVRRALAVWGVTTIVVPVQEDLPLHDRGRSSAYAVGLFTAATGTAPRFSHAAWVWSSVRTPAAPVPMTAAAFVRCTTGAVAAAPAPQAVPTCVVASRP